MICKHCKAENEDGALFCSNCGKPLEDEEYDREKMRGIRSCISEYLSRL